MKRLFLAALFALSILLPTVSEGAAVQVQFLLGSFLDNDAEQMAGGLVYTYAAGTTTPKATYTDAAKTTTAANPVVLDSYGRANIYADGQYKFVIKTSAAVTVATYDNLEFVSAVTPTTLVVTSATVASLTATQLFAQGGTVANATFSGGLVSNSSLGNCVILALPTAASHPVNLSYLQTQIASQAAFDAAALSAHSGDSTDPHGSTLTQSALIASSVTADSVGKNIGDGTNGGWFALTASGATLSGTENNVDLAFKSATLPGSEYTLKYKSSDSTLNLVWHYPFDTSSHTITFNPGAGGSIDFGGATLKNFSAESTGGGSLSEVQVIVSTSATQIGIPSSGYAILCAVSIPASFSAGWYEVSWDAVIGNASGSMSNYGSFGADLFVGSTLVAEQIGYVGSNAGAITEFDAPHTTTVVYLSPANVLSIKAEQGTIVGTGVQSYGHHLLARFLGTTKRAY